MLILGIETSCDDTGVALYDSRAGKLVSHAVHTQAALHEVYGGVVPELASRDHIRRLVPLTRKVLGDRSIDGIGYTEGPGLAGALLVGASFAHALAVSLGVPAIGIHHLEGHLLSPLLSATRPEFPFLALLVSGGHTQLMRVDGVGRYELLGDTQDDAAGEAFDKTAQLLGLGYPGGPAVERLAREGDDRAILFPKTRLTHADRNAPELPGRRDFSFSGLKTSVLRHVTRRRESLGLPKGDPLPHGEIADICASFQRVVVATLLDQLFRAAREHGARSVGIAGGVSANRRLRDDACAAGESLELPVFIPTLALSTDNAAMIGAAGLRKLRAGQRSELDANADPALVLGS
jgi:N6-L-threonylcarbamoyladenine synthase